MKPDFNNNDNQRVEVLTNRELQRPAPVQRNQREVKETERQVFDSKNSDYFNEQDDYFYN